jgi:hypothetical protein
MIAFVIVIIFACSFVTSYFIMDAEKVRIENESLKGELLKAALVLKEMLRRENERNCKSALRELPTTGEQPDREQYRH